MRAPTILLVSEEKLGDGVRASGSAAKFIETISPQTSPGGSPQGRDRLIFGALVRQPWKHTLELYFGGDNGLPLQLRPFHDVFVALIHNYVAFTKPQASLPSSIFGCSPPNAMVLIHSPWLISLILGSSFEFGVFAHDSTARGAYTLSITRRYEFQGHSRSMI